MLDKYENSKHLINEKKAFKNKLNINNINKL